MLAAAPGGHLWVLWFNHGKDVIQAVRTDAAAKGFGPVLTILPPNARTFFDGLQAEGSAGPLDIVAHDADYTPGQSPSYWDAQILPRLAAKHDYYSASVTVKVT